MCLQFQFMDSAGILQVQFFTFLRLEINSGSRDHVNALKTALEEVGLWAVLQTRLQVNQIETFSCETYKMIIFGRAKKLTISYS